MLNTRKKLFLIRFATIMPLNMYLIPGISPFYHVPGKDVSYAVSFILLGINTMFQNIILVAELMKILGGKT